MYGKTKTHRIWMLFNLSLAWWGVGVFFMGKCTSPAQTLFVTKIAYIGVIFISVFFYHFSCVFAGVNRRGWIIFAYIQGLLFSLLSVSNTGIPYISNVERIDGSSLYYIRSSGWLYNLSFIIWLSLVGAGFIETVIQYLKESYFFKKNQYLYLFWGFFVGFLGGLTNFLPPFHIDIVPIGNFTIPLYCIIATYAILRYQLLDIRLALSNTVIFIVVYALVLGVPFIFGYKFHKWEISTWAMLFLASLGPVIFNFLSKQAENRILEQQKRYQKVIETFSINLNTFKTVDNIINKTCYMLYKSIRLKNLAFYLMDDDKLVIKRTDTNDDQYQDEIANKELIGELASRNQCIVIKEFNGDNHKNKKNLFDFNHVSLAEIALPLVQEEKLVGLILFGEKDDGSLFSKIDFDTLNQISHQIALAIAYAQSNLLYLDAEKKQIAQENEIKRLKQHELFSKNLAHQINNPLNMINGSLETFEAIHELYKSKIEPEDYFAIENETRSAKDSHRRLSKMVEMLLKKGKRYVSKAVFKGIDSIKGTILDPGSISGIWESVSTGEVKLKPGIELTQEDIRKLIKSDFDKFWPIYHQALKGVVKLRKLKVSEILEGFDIQKKSILNEYNISLGADVDKNCPEFEVKADDIRVVEGLIIYLNNSAQAVVQNAGSKNVQFKVYKTDDNFIRFEISDNGHGVDEDMKEGLFEVSASTKGTEGNGIGLLYVRQDVCEEIPNSRYGCFSEGRGKGSKFWLDFKIANGQ